MILACSATPWMPCNIHTITRDILSIFLCLPYKPHALENQKNTIPCHNIFPSPMPQPPARPSPKTPAKITLRFLAPRTLTHADIRQCEQLMARLDQARRGRVAVDGQMLGVLGQIVDRMRGSVGEAEGGSQGGSFRVKMSIRGKGGYRGSKTEPAEENGQGNSKGLVERENRGLYGNTGRQTGRSRGETMKVMEASCENQKEGQIEEKKEQEIERLKAKLRKITASHKLKTLKISQMTLKLSQFQQTNLALYQKLTSMHNPDLTVRLAPIPKSYEHSSCQNCSPRLSGLQQHAYEQSIRQLQLMTISLAKQVQCLQERLASTRC